MENFFTDQFNGLRVMIGVVLTERGTLSCNLNGRRRDANITSAEAFVPRTAQEASVSQELGLTA
jgi:hypothetical protein